MARIQAQRAPGTSSTSTATSAGPAVASPSNGAVASGVESGGTEEGYLDGVEAPSEIEINSAVGRIAIAVPPDARPSTTISGSPPSPIEGLDIRNITVTVDENFRPTSGSADVAVTKGPVTGTGNMAIADGNLSGEVDVNLNLGEFGVGTGKASLGEGGFSSSGVIQAGNLALKNGLTANGGEVEWTQDAAGTVTGSGSVSGEIPQIGAYTLAVQYNETLSGQGSLTLVERSIVGDAKVLGGVMEGAYSAESFIVNGSLRLGIGDWAAGDGTGTVDINTREATGTASATVTGLQKEGFQLHSGAVEASVEANQWTGGTVAVDASAKGFRGQAVGTYDPVAGMLDATLTGALEAEEKALSESVDLLEAGGTLSIVQNQVTAITNANAQIGIDIAGERAVEAGISSATVDIASGEVPSLSGHATGSTTRDIPLAGGRLDLRMGMAETDVTANTISEVTGAAEVDVGEAGAEKLFRLSGTGTVGVSPGTVQEAEGTVSLLKNPWTIAEGLDITAMTGNASVANDELTTAGLSASYKTPNFEGEVEGTFDPKDSVVDGEVTTAMHTPLEAAAGASMDTASGKLTVAQNAVNSFEGSATGDISEKIFYEATDLNLDVPTKMFGGEVTAGLKEGQSMTLANVGTLSTLRGTGTVVDNDIERVEGELGGTFDPGGTPLLAFAASGAYRAKEKVVERAEGTVDLTAPQTFGALTIDSLNAGVSVAENVPTIAAGSVGFHTERFTGSVEEAQFDLTNKQVSGTATVDLTAPIDFGALHIESADGSVTVTNNELSEMTGNIEGTVAVGDKTIDFIAEDATVDMIANAVSGTVSASSPDYFELVPGRLKVKVNDATGEVTANDLTSVSGDVQAVVMNGGEDALEINGTGEYDIKANNVVSATGDTTLLKEFGVLDDKITVDQFEANVTVANNELTSGQVTAGATFNQLDDGTRVVFTGGFTNGDAGFDIAGSAEVEEFHIIQPTAEGRELKGGMSGEVDTAARTFAVSGDLEYQINENFGGTLHGEMDQEFDPSFGGSLRGQADLVQATPDLFSIEKTLVSIPIPPIFGASLDASLALDVGALSVAPEITVADGWKPLSQNDLPDFETNTAANWSVTLRGALIPYLYGGLKLPGVTAAVGALGKAELSADAGVNADVALNGIGGEFSGEVGLGVNVAGSIDLSAGLFAKLGVAGWDAVDWEKGDMVSYELADLFNMDWATTFKFGDAGPSEEAGAEVAATDLAPSQSQGATAEAATEAPAAKSKEESKDASAPGGPSISGASAMESLNQDEKSADGGDEELSGLELAMNALEAMKNLYSRVGGAIEQLADFPMGTFALIWDIFTGQFSFEDVFNDAKAVADSLVDLMKFVAPMLEGWFTGFWNYIKDGPPSLLSALFGDSGAFRDVINDGVTIQNAPQEMLVHLLEGALWDDMFTTAADERACMTVMQVAVSRGLIGTILTPERTRKIFSEMDHSSSAFRDLVVQNAPAEVLRSEINRFTGHMWLRGGEEDEAMVYIEAAASRGMLQSALSADAAADILSGMDGDNEDRMREILRANGYRV